ncbi:solute carrier family 28 member 3-like [Mercenaria mercenaria]|uniref:solute carrier family 28 member 3-like n=1 Tax=Mercenaria mercenaria TaxID=6596 RepID=UPI00234E8493|nr:solute carrier family 28 member 3-like [Mercenaria mercenaria]
MDNKEDHTVVISDTETVTVIVDTEQDDDTETVTVIVDTEKDDDYQYNVYQRRILFLQETVTGFYKAHKKVTWTAITLIIFMAYFVYFGLALNYRFGDEGSWRLLGFTIFGVLLLVLILLCDAYDTKIDDVWKRNESLRNSKTTTMCMKVISWFLRIGVFVTVIVYVILDIAIDHPQNLISVAGLILYILIFYITSVNPARVNWHTVFWGIALQYVFALVILRTQWGYDIFKWLGDRVTEFLEHTMAGVLFVFGNTWSDHFFAMKVLSIVVFFFTFINIMYYLGVMQAIIKVFGGFLAFCMGTTPAESINAAANIFGSMIDSPMMIRPLLKDMTRSELHAVMTGGFATIAGSVLGAYITFGVPANHLLSASVMSAPAALAIAKLSYPETQRSKASNKDFSKLEKPPEHNIIEAASNGASSSIKVVGAIAVNVLAFLSLLAFLNATLTWFGERVGIEGLTFEFMCSYVLYPVSFFMGVDTDDCRKVAELVGVKTFTNEFIAYSSLKVLIQNKKDLNNYTDFFNTTDWYWQKDNVVLNMTGQVLEGGFISEKSEIIATYALCGFANFGSIGITLGGVGALAPSRKPELSQMVLRAMICGNVACFLTACIAGLLYKPF